MRPTGALSTGGQEMSAEEGAALTGQPGGVTIRQSSIPDPCFLSCVRSVPSWLDAIRIDGWVTTYQHVLADPEAIIDWIRGTGLRPFLEALPGEEPRDRFVARLLEQVTADYPRRADGKVIFPFRRLFFVAYRA